MKKTFFKSVVATAVVTAAMALSSVAVFAAVPEDDPTVAVEIGSTYNVSTSGTDKLFSSSNTAGNTATSSDSRFIANCKVDGAGLNLKKGDGYGAKFLTPTDSACKVTFTNSTSNSYQVSWEEDGETKTSSDTTVKLPANTVCSLTGTDSSSAKIATITVKTAEEPTAYYTLSGTVTVGGTAQEGVVLTLTGSDYADLFTATTNENGYYEFTNIGNIETVSITVTRGASYSGAAYEDISMAEGDVTKNIELSKINSISTSAFLNASTMTFSDGTTITDGAVLDENSYFVAINGLQFQTSSIPSYGNIDYTKRFNTYGAGSTESRAIMFTITEPAYVQVVFMTGSSDSTRSCILSDGTEGNTFSASSSSQTVATALNAYLSVAGTYYVYGDASIRIGSINVVCNANLTASTSGTTTGTGAAAAYASNNGTYVLAAITADDAEANNTLYLGSTSQGEKVASTETVYDTVCVDNFVFTASDVTSADADYVYALQLTDVGDNDITNDISTAIVTLE